MKSFSNVTKQEIIDILLDAIDTDGWHTPSVGNLEIIEQNNSVIYGKFTSSLHNTYRNEERGFQINIDSVQVWGIDMVVNNSGNLVEKKRFKPLHNVIKIGQWLSEFKLINA